MADIFYVESGYVDSGYAVYTADAVSTVSASATLQTSVNVVRNTSATLNCQATVSSQGQLTRAGSATLSAVAGVSSLGGSLIAGTATLNAIASLQADILRTRASASLLASAGSLSASGGTIKRIGLSAQLPGQTGVYLDTGIRTSSTQYINVVDNNFTNYYLKNNTAIAFWYKADSSSATDTIFEWDWYGNNQTLFRIRKEGNILRLRALNNVGINCLWDTTWTLSVNDTSWHQYTFQIKNWSTGFNGQGLKVEVFQDGVSLGENSTTGSATAWYNTQYLASTISIGKTANGCFAQLWIGEDTSFSTSKYYSNGWVDIAATGWLDIPGNFDYGNKVFLIRDGVAANKDYLLLPNADQVLDLPAIATINALGGSTYRASATLSSTASIYALGDKNILGSSTLTAQASISINGDVIGGGVAPMLVTASLSARGDATYSQSATLSAQAAVEASSTYAIFGSGQLDSTSSMRVVTGNEATLVATSSLTVDPTYSYDSRATLTATATIDATGVAGKFAIARLNAEFSVVGKLTIVPIPDDLQTIFVPSESRGLRVLPETRFATVELESNLNRILMETRDLTVPYESRQLREAVDPALQVTTERIRRIPA